MNFRSRSIALQRQRGNTLIGIIIGLVIGLGIAVVVALAITKGATPFTDKGKAGKVPEPTAGQIADPNKPMYGNKDAAREANKDFEHAPKPPAPDALQQEIDKVSAQAAPAAKPAPAAGAPATPAAPVASLDRSKSASNVAPVIATPATTPAAVGARTAAATADAGDDKFVYYLQAGAFREVADAESARAKLALLGFEANVSDRSSDTGVLHRVRMGPYTQVEAMNKVRSKLSENGVDVAVVRNQK